MDRGKPLLHICPDMMLPDIYHFEYRVSKNYQSHINYNCLLIYLVSSPLTSIDGWGIRLPLTLKKWHRQADFTRLILSSDVGSEIHGLPCVRLAASAVNDVMAVAAIALGEGEVVVLATFTIF